MRKCLLCVSAIAVSLAVTVLAPRAAPSVPALWTKAVAIYEANKNLVPGTMTQTVEELDGDGAVKSSTVSALRFSPDPAAEQGVKTEIVSVVKDGKDVTLDVLQLNVRPGEAVDAASGKALLVLGDRPGLTPTCTVGETRDSAGYSDPIFGQTGENHPAG